MIIREMRINFVTDILLNQATFYENFDTKTGYHVVDSLKVLWCAIAWCYDHSNRKSSCGSFLKVRKRASTAVRRSHIYSVDLSCMVASLK